ncbi:MAG: NAD-dependent epimerase/dehydratase family protein [Chlamydiales bacterium]
MINYLVTGGCGFIGAHLVRALLNEGYGVKVLDNLSSGQKESIPNETELIVGSVTDREKVKEALEGVDGCFHLAAVASVEKTIQNWTDSHSINVGGMVRILETIAESKKQIPFIYASSAAVYGNGLNLPIKEEHPLQPISPYGIDKMGCEYHAKAAWSLHHIPNIGFRLFNVYGPTFNTHPDVITLFAQKISKGKKIFIMGNGEQTRDFVYVADVVKIMMHAMQQLFQGAEIYNVCSGKETSILLISNLLGKIAGIEVIREYLPAKKGEILHSVGDPFKLLHFLKLKTETSIEKGLYQIMKEIDHRAIMK